MSFFKPSIHQDQRASSKGNDLFFQPPARLRDKNNPESENEIVQNKTDIFGEPNFFQPQPKLSNNQSTANDTSQVNESATEEIQLQEQDPKSTEGSSGQNATQTETETPSDQSQPETEGETAKETTISNSVDEPTANYWTHAWHTDRFGNEVLFIWEVGGKRRYSNANKGYAYIREKAGQNPEDSGYDARFETHEQGGKSNTQCWT